VLLNYAEINRVIKQEEFTPHLEFDDKVSVRPASPRIKKLWKRSKSPKAGKKKSKAEDAARARVSLKLPTEVPIQPVVKHAEVVQPEIVEPPTLATAHESNDRDILSGLTPQDIYTLLLKKISNLEVKAGERRPEKSLSGETPVTSGVLSTPDRPISRGITPGRVAAQNFFDRALRDPPPKLGNTNPPPSDPSDDSSSSSDEGSKSPHPDGTGSSRRRASSPRLSSKRRRGDDRKQKMLLRPIPPSRYNGEPNANAIQRFARESKTYVKMGRVPEEQQVFFVSYYLDGKALDFIIKWSYRTRRHGT
jgi:hypothetical protein